jgi:hypothetical protein
LGEELSTKDQVNWNRSVFRNINNFIESIPNL